MTTATSAENVRQYKSSFPLTVEQVLVFALSTNLVRLVENFQKNCMKMIYVTDNSHSDR